MAELDITQYGHHSGSHFLCSCHHLCIPFLLSAWMLLAAFKRKTLFSRDSFSCLATSTYFRGQMCYLTVVETTWTPEVGTWQRKEEEQMFIDFTAKHNCPQFSTLHTIYSCKYKTLGSNLCVLVDILGVPPDLTCIFHTATFQHCKQQPSEIWGAQTNAPHRAK